MADYTKAQKELFRQQAAIAELMRKIMESREQLTGAKITQDAEGNKQWTGPLADALRMALANAARAQQRPRNIINIPAYSPFSKQ